MATKNKSPIDDVFDFGFTTVDEHELEAVQRVSSEKLEETALLELKLNKLYSAIIPLLQNLKNNPDKDYIFWPNRIEKVEAFEKQLQKIIEE